MRDYEELILARQDANDDISDYADDDCASCKYLQECRDGVKVGGCVYNDGYEDNYRNEVEYLLRDF